MNKHFLAKLGEFFRTNKAAIEAAEITPEEIEWTIKQARAYSGGKQKAENRMSMSESFSREKEEWRLFMEQQFAEPPSTIQVLPKAGVYSHPRYGKINMTPKEIEAFVENHNKHVYQEQVPIDAEHQSKLSGAVGYYKEMRLIDGGKGGAEADVEWTERGRELIASDSFKYFSPEWVDTWTDPVSNQKISNVLVGGAITTRPFFKDKAMRPLVASESGYQAGEWSVDETDVEKPIRTLSFTAMEFSEEDSKQANIDTGDVHINGLIEPTGGDAEDKTKKQESSQDSGGKKAMELDEATKSFVEEQTKKLNEQLDEEKGLRKAAEDRLEKLETEAKTRRFSDIIMGKDAAGDGSPPFLGEHSPHQMMLSLIAKEFGEDSEQFTSYVSAQRSIAKQAREAGLFKEAGASTGGTSGAADAIRKFDEEVETWLAAHDGKGRGAAIEAIAAAKPKLYTDYVKEKNRQAKAASTSYGYEDDEDGE